MAAGGSGSRFLSRRTRFLPVMLFGVVMAVGQVLQVLFEFPLIHDISSCNPSASAWSVALYTTARDLLLKDKAWRHDWQRGCRFF